MKNICLTVLSRKSKKKRSKRLVICILMFLILASATTCYFYSSYYNSYHEQQNLKSEKQKIIKAEEKLISSIKKKYSNNVITIQESIIYSLINDEYVEVGKLASGVNLLLGDILIEKSTLYFPIISFKNIYYISYNDVEPKENVNLISESSRYKKYVPFDKNVVTGSVTNLYKDNVLIYQIPESITAPIYKIDNNKYYIEYLGDLYYVLDNEISEVVEHENSSAEVTSGIATIAYHFFYKDGDWNNCAQIICTSESLFRKQLDYLKENNYFTPTMSEFEEWIDGKINLPKKTVMITIDDGWKSELGVEILNEYKMNATLFLITSQYQKSLAWGTVEAASHSNNLHKQGDCPMGQGGGIQCLPEAKIQEDLSLSREQLDGTTYFCYPFYEYNAYSIANLKKAGFTMAFAGMYSNGSLKMHRGDNKFKIPRVTFLYDTNVEDLKGIL